MAGIVAGMFNTTADAERAIRALIGANFSDDRIGVVVHDRDIGPGIADDLGREYRAGINPPEKEMTSPSDVYETIPGGFIRTVQKDERMMRNLDWYRSQLDAGKVMVIVDAGERADDAMHIMHQYGMMTSPGMGVPMETGAMPTTTTTPTTATTTTPTPTEMTTATTTGREEVHVPVIDEEVVVERMPHQVGDVEVTSETTTTPVDVPTMVTHEEIRVERHKLDRPMRPDEYTATSPEGGVIRMPIVEEEIRVTKTPIIREELIVTRIPVNEQQTLHETVMHSEPHVETHGDVDVEGGEGNVTRGPDVEEKKRPAA